MREYVNIGFVLQTQHETTYVRSFELASKRARAVFVQQVSLTSSTMFLPHTCLFAIYELNYPEAITALGMQQK